MYVCIYMYIYIHVWTYPYVCTYMNVYTDIYIYICRQGQCARRSRVQSLNCIHITTLYNTGWRRPIGCLKLQVIFRKRSTNFRVFLRKLTYKDKALYGSSPPCISIHIYVTYVHHTLHIIWRHAWYICMCTGKCIVHEDLDCMHNMKHIDTVRLSMYICMHISFICICMCTGKCNVHEDLDCIHYMKDIDTVHL